MEEPRFRVPRVEWSAVNSRTGRKSHHHRHRNIPSIMRRRRVVDELVKSARYEICELNFGHWFHSHKRGSRRRTENRRFREHGVYHSITSKVIQESLRRFERAAIFTDVLPEKKHG